MYGDTSDVDNERGISGNAYSVITPLRMLLMMDSNCDKWKRSNQLMDHIDGKKSYLKLAKPSVSLIHIYLEISLRSGFPKLRAK